MLVVRVDCERGDDERCCDQEIERLFVAKVLVDEFLVDS